MTITRHSHILDQAITVDEKTRTVTTQDGAVYSERELMFMKPLRKEEKRLIHTIKRQFSGEVVA